MAVSQTLSVKEVANSQNISANNSKVRILWQSTQTGSSWNGYTKSATYYVSINGGAETAYTVSYTLPQNSTTTIVDVTITVPHKSDGSGTVKVRTYMNTGISAGEVTKEETLTLATIPRVSVPTLSAKSVAFGEAITIYTNRQSSSFTHHLYYSVNGEKAVGITSGIGANFTWTVDAELMRKIPNATSAEITFTLYTFSGDNNIGNNTISFTATVPNNSSTQPKVTMSLSPVHSLGDAFKDLYIQGKSKVKATISADGEYDASIKSYKMNVLSKDYSSPFESEYLNTAGVATVTGYATDSRGITGSAAQEITVIPYIAPKIQPVSGEGNVVAVRCNEHGDTGEGGIYLKIKAKRNYSPMMLDGVQHNHCTIRFRYKAAQGVYSDWMTILHGSSTTTDEIVTDPILLGDGLSLSRTYIVQVGVIDDVGEHAETTITVPTDKVYCHRDGRRNSFTFGGYVEEDNTFAIASGVTFRALGGIGKIALYDGNNFNDLVYVTGYYASTSAPSSVGCANYPVDKTGVLEVISQMSQNKTTGAWWGFAWQTYRTHDGEIYTRSFFTTNGWTPWMKHTGTAIT